MSREAAFCGSMSAPSSGANSVSNILRGVPGFESIPATYFPNKLHDAFAQLPGVTEREIRDEDADNNHGVLIVQASEAPK